MGRTKLLIKYFGNRCINFQTFLVNQNLVSLHLQGLFDKLDWNLIKIDKSFEKDVRKHYLTTSVTLTFIFLSSNVKKVKVNPHNASLRVIGCVISKSSLFLRKRS